MRTELHKIAEYFEIEIMIADEFDFIQKKERLREIYENIQKFCERNTSDINRAAHYDLCYSGRMNPTNCAMYCPVWKLKNELLKELKEERKSQERKLWRSGTSRLSWYSRKGQPYP